MLCWIMFSCEKEEKVYISGNHQENNHSDNTNNAESFDSTDTEEPVVIAYKVSVVYSYSATEMEGCTIIKYLNGVLASDVDNTITGPSTLTMKTYHGSTIIGSVDTHLEAEDGFSTIVKFYNKNKKIIDSGLATVTAIYTHPDEGQSEDAKRRVLLEEFTGQRCINSIYATEVIEQLQKEYGESLVAVEIHSGPFGVKDNATNIGLATNVGNEYYNYWNIGYQPVALINRQTPTNSLEWATAIKEEIGKSTKLSIKGDATFAKERISMYIKLQNTGGTTVGHLQVWLTEDGITAPQYMPDGSLNYEYVHNHVLRTAVNGTWGEDFALMEGTTRDFTYTLEVNPAWNTKELSIVAFAYNDLGVIEAVKIPVITTTNQLLTYGKWYLHGFGGSIESMNFQSKGEYLDIMNDHELIWGGQMNGHNDLYTYSIESDKIKCIRSYDNMVLIFQIVSLSMNEMILYNPSDGLYRHWILDE